MAKRKTLVDPVRTRVLEDIDELVEGARSMIQKANDLAELLNALDTSGDKIEIDGNVVVGVFNKEVK